MSRKHLGDTIDLHSGGEDLLFPHHENEIAQSEGCSGHLFSHHWFHCKFLLVDDRKMSKSLGNLYTLDDLVAKGFSRMAVRYALLAGHPRKQLSFTIDSLHAAESAIKQIKELAKTVRFQARADSTPLSDFDETPANDAIWGDFGEAWSHLIDDLNIPGAFGVIFSVRNKKYTTSFVKPYLFKDPNEAERDYLGLKKLLFALGIQVSTGTTADHIIAVPGEVVTLAEKRWAARQAKDFKAADALRQELAAAGWSMLDGKDGYRLEPLKR
jgi:cysteinyl-tRNA synthetase